MASKCIRLPTDGAPTGLEPTEYIAPQTVQSGEPEERGRSFYTDRTGQLDAGVWACEPNRHSIEAAPYDEFVYLLKGRIDVIDDEGGTETFKAGDSFMMPRGCKCTWDVKEPMQKLYVVLTAEAYPG
jgi:uncharacterized cupin superfamily protein